MVVRSSRDRRSCDKKTEIVTEEVDHIYLVEGFSFF